METLLSWAASLADPESNRRYRHTWSPSTLPTIAALCPFVVYGRIENRIRDLERGGDGFGVPYCNLNGRCVCGTFQFCCCCFCCCGYAEILVLQRDMARIWGYPRPESETDEHTARRRPWRFLAETEAGLHAALSARDRRRHILAVPYRPEPPMRAASQSRGRGVAFTPDGSPGSPAPLFDPPITLGPPSGPLAILPGQYPSLFDIEEGEAEGSRRESRRGSRAGSGLLVVGDAAGDVWRGRRRSPLGECFTAGGSWPSASAGPSRFRTPGTPQGSQRCPGGTPGDSAGARGGEAASDRVPSRIIISGSESNIVADSGAVDGAGDEGGSWRVRSVRVRMSISRESVVEPGEEGG